MRAGSGNERPSEFPQALGSINALISNASLALACYRERRRFVTAAFKRRSVRRMTASQNPKREFVGFIKQSPCR